MYEAYANKYINDTNFKPRLDAIFGVHENYLCLVRASNPYCHEVYLDVPKTKIGHFNLYCYPANCGALITYDTTAMHPYLKMGVGTLLIELQEVMAKHLGFTYLTGTVACHQPFIERILKKRKWKLTDSFENNRTHHKINVWGKNVRAS